MPSFKVTQAGAGGRADLFLTAKLKQYSRSALKSLFEADQITIGGKAVRAGQKLKAGQTLKVDTGLISKRPKPVKIPVIFEDNQMMVLDKPAGILTHSKGALNHEPTVASFIANRLKDRSLTGSRAGIVHRLDRGTSGVIVTAKTAPALAYLQRQFSTRKANKTYLAIVEGRPEPAQALIDAPIGRNPKRPQSFKVSTSGKPAQTQYKLLRSITDKTSLVELKPLTGRTNQLRIHMAYIGHPIVGDQVYGHKSGGRLMLHASELTIALPDGQQKTFKSKLGTSFGDQP